MIDNMLKFIKDFSRDYKMFDFIKNRLKPEETNKSKSSLFEKIIRSGIPGISLDGNILHSAKQSKKLRGKSSGKKRKVNKEKLSVLKKLKALLPS